HPSAFCCLPALLRVPVFKVGFFRSLIRCLSGDSLGILFNANISKGMHAMSAVATKIKEEFLELLPPTIFFFVTLHVIALIRALMLEGTGIAPMTSVSVTVAAL